MGPAPSERRHLRSASRAFCTPGHTTLDLDASQTLLRSAASFRDARFHTRAGSIRVCRREEPHLLLRRFSLGEAQPNSESW